MGEYSGFRLADLWEVFDGYRIVGVEPVVHVVDGAAGRAETALVPADYADDDKYLAARSA